MDKNHFLIDLSDSERTDDGRVNFSLQPVKQEVFSCIWSLGNRVNSGGFSSFFSYDDPALVAFTPEALSTIGAVNCAEIVRRATQLAAGADIDVIEEELGELDDEFYAYPDNLTDLLLRTFSSTKTHLALRQLGSNNSFKPRPLRGSAAW